MTVRILGGIAKGFVVVIPDSGLIRPTSVLLKRRFFDTFQNWSNSIFIDLCAGAGVVGLEAASRGANTIFIEKDSEVCKILNKNISNFIGRYKGFLADRNQKNPKMIKRDVYKFLSSYLSSYNIDADKNLSIYLDPPYKDIKIYCDIIELVVKLDRPIKNFFLESDIKKGLSFLELDNLLNKYKFETKKVIKQGTRYIAQIINN